MKMGRARAIQSPQSPVSNPQSLFYVSFNLHGQRGDDVSKAP